MDCLCACLLYGYTCSEGFELCLLPHTAKRLILCAADTVGSSGLIRIIQLHLGLHKLCVYIPASEHHAYNADDLFFGIGNVELAVIVHRHNSQPRLSHGSLPYLR